VPRAWDSQGARTRGVLDGLGAKGLSRSFDTIPFDRSRTISYWLSMFLFCRPTVSEI